MKPHLFLLTTMLWFLAGCGGENAAKESTESAASAETATPVPQLGNIQLEWEFTTVTLPGGELEYATLLPFTYEPAQSFPLLLALPPGGQDKSMVDAGLGSVWQVGAVYGFIVVSPAKPADANFMGDASLLLPDFVAHLQSEFNITGKPHLGGISNGGISAFKAALEQPDLYQSLTVLPGYARGDDGDIAGLVDLRVTLYVGENDGGWVTNSQSTYDRLVAAGHEDVVLEIFPGEDHFIQSLRGDGAAQIFERLLGD